MLSRKAELQVATTISELGHLVNAADGTCVMCRDKTTEIGRVLIVPLDKASTR